MQQAENKQELHLADYYHVLVKHRALIVACLVITVTLTMLVTFLMAPVFMATATLIIDKEKSTSSLTGERVDYESYVSQSLTFNTHFKLINSRPVIEKVIEKLDLERHARTNDLKTGLLVRARAQIKENLRLLLGLEHPVLTEEEKRLALIEDIREKIDIENVRDTRLLRINIEDADPALARDMANELAAAYIDYNISNRMESSRDTLAWMTNQLYEMKKKLEDAEQEFLAYKQREKLFSMQGKEKVIDQKIAEFNDAYLATRNKRLELDAKLEKLDQYLDGSGDIGHVRSILNNPLIESLYSQLIEAEVELARLGKVYRHKHPKVLQAESKIEDTRKKIQEQLKKEKENLRVERSVLLSREKVLEGTVADFEQDALETNRKALTYNILQRNMDTNRELYDILLAKIKEANVEGNQDASNIRVAEKASIPMDPVKPKKKLNLLLSVIVGLMVGVGLAFLIEYMDRSLHTEDDVQKYLGLPVLAVVPLVEPPQKSRPAAKGGRKEKVPEDRRLGAEG